MKCHYKCQPISNLMLSVVIVTFYTHTTWNWVWSIGLTLLQRLVLISPNNYASKSDLTVKDIIRIKFCIYIFSFKICRYHLLPIKVISRKRFTYKITSRHVLSVLTYLIKYFENVTICNRYLAIIMQDCRKCLSLVITIVNIHPCTLLVKIFCINIMIVSNMLISTNNDRMT